MAKSDTMYVGPNGSGRPKCFQMIEDEERVITIDLRAYLGNKGTTASQIVVDSDNSGVVSLHTAAISSGVATVEIHADATGLCMVKGTITLASGEVLVRKFYVKVTDPQTASDTAYQ